MKIHDDIELPPHIIEEHINIDDSMMIDRLINGTFRNLRYTTYSQKIVTKFFNEEKAKQMISIAIIQNEFRLKEWMKLRYEKKIVLNYYSLEEIGYGIAKGTDFNIHYPMTGICVVLELGYNGNNFNILTAYPIPSPFIIDIINKDKKKYWKFKNKK